jgi:membrane-associated phospholipid phosphatase
MGDMSRGRLTSTILALAVRLTLSCYVFRRELLIMLGLGALSVVLILYGDLPLAQAIKSLEGTLLFLVAAATTDIGKAPFYLVVSALAFLLCRYWLRNRLRASQAAFVFVAVAVSGIAADIVKVVVARTRPKLYFRDGNYGFEMFKFGHDFNSFPSGHATTVGALTAAFIVLFPRYRLPIAAAGVAAAATRVIIDAHYLSDVLFGFGLGVVTVTILQFAFERRDIHLHGPASSYRLVRQTGASRGHDEDHPGSPR